VSLLEVSTSTPAAMAFLIGAIQASGSNEITTIAS